MSLGNPLSSYLTEVLERDSAHAYSNLNDAVNGKIVFNDFEDASLDLETFDWKSGPVNRNWWWQLQQFPFVKWYTQAGRCLEDGTANDDVLIDFLWNGLKQWKACAEKYPEESPLMWHDHATALRLRHLTDLYVVLFGRKSSHHALKKFLDQEIVCHAHWLAKDKNYSKRTNHGFEQADILLRASLIFPECEDLITAREISRERLLDEVGFAFTKQGVHKENSPGYHQFMIGKLVALSDYERLGDNQLSKVGEEYLDNARSFLSALTLPDGTLPLLGDTRGGMKVKFSEIEDVNSSPLQLSGVCIWDYSESGYIIVGYEDELTNNWSKLIVRAGQFSHYHRHDDDLSIYWQIGDKLILGDGGLYSHNEKDLKRIFVRSPMAHNTLYVPGVEAERKVSRTPRKARLGLKSDPLRVVAETFCYKGWRLRRVINIEKITKGEVLIEDQAHSDFYSGFLATNWFLGPGYNHCIQSEKEGVKYSSEKGGAVAIRPGSTRSSVVTYSGWSGDMCNSAISSSEFGVYKKSSRMTSYWEGPGKHKTYLKVNAFA
ncbi:heparinase II/III family protein [Salinicola avicenniae]|uniref:heparinase II/III family protein n=1 Tax=Salinicola avicenniae TaxID=2916836 RepID=UPI0020738380|nr:MULTISPECIES: heparinase II/III family protein [unclassified Salinicola]